MASDVASAPLPPSLSDAQAAPRQPVHGLLMLDKPEGITSQQALSRFKPFLPKKWKIGHAGTLDPFATGLLPVALGEATKTLQWMIAEDKRYQFTLRFGEETDTLDPTGQITRRLVQSPPSPDAIRQAILSFAGSISQIPPAYSAIHVAGKRAYALAREGADVSLPPRQVTIHQLTYLDSPTPQEARFDVHCSKGTYVRSLARDIAYALGTVGHVTELRRLQVGMFHVKHAISLDFALDCCYKRTLSTHLLALDAGLDDIPAMHLSPADAQAIRQGQSLATPQEDTPLLRVYGQGERLIAMATVLSGQLRPIRVFNH